MNERREEEKGWEREEKEGLREGTVEQTGKRRECEKREKETAGRAGGRCDRWRLSFSR